ncbi:RdgB/HAM1 family non-canonical purine NTP pyrophosphatase [Bacteroidota bacterium]
MDICFATNNEYKLQEIKALLGKKIKILGLQEIGCTEELPENQDTLEGNSKEKAEYVFEHFKVVCFADDTGLEVDCLNGAPGVKSARFAGEQRSSEDNISLLLAKLKNETNRSARFRTVISLAGVGKLKQFEGVIEGKIIGEKRGNDGFGYDPVFLPESKDLTFAQMPLSEKNKISHRAVAFRKLIQYLQNI